MFTTRSGTLSSARALLLALALIISTLFVPAAESDKITHSFLATGAETRIVDGDGKTNKDLPEPLIKDACGGQRLPNGNTVICAYGIGARRTKLLEVTPDKKVVWTFTEEKGAGIHEVQILDTNGKPLEGAPLR